MNPVAVDEKLEELSALLEAQAEANYRLAIAGAEAEADYRAATAVERLKVRDEHKGEKLTEGTIDAMVTDRTADLLQKRLVAQAKHEAGRDSLFATRARIDALRTMAASHREAAKG